MVLDGFRGFVPGVFVCDQCKIWVYVEGFLDVHTRVAGCDP